MAELSNGERSLVGLGAALGSNCVPCIEHYVSEARSSGLSDRQIEDAIRLADGVRRVPAQRVLDAALGLVVVTDQPEANATAQAERTKTGAAREERPETAGTTSQTACAEQSRCCG